MSGKKRIAWVDIVKYVCIIFVMASHLGNNNIAPELRSFYSGFFLTGFLFVSGYTYRFTPGFLNHLRKKTKQLFIPWFTFSTANILLAYIFTLRPEKHTDLWQELWKNFLQVRGYSDGMWFVSALFTAYLFFYFFVKWFEKYRQTRGAAGIKTFIILSILLYFANWIYTAFMPKAIFPWKSNALPWHLEYIPYAVYFMFMGYLFQQSFEKKFDAFFSKEKTALLIIAYLLIVFVPYAARLRMPRYISSVYSFAESNLAVMMLVAVSKHAAPNRYLLFVGQNTLIYFGLHGKFVSLWEAVFREILPSVYTAVYTSHFLSAVYSILFGIAISVVLIVPAMMINRFFPFMMGIPYTKVTPEQHNSDSEKHQ